MSSAHSVTINVSCEAAVGPDRPSEWAEQLCITVNSFHIVSDNTTLKNGHACYLVPWSPTNLPPVIMPPQPPPHLTLDNFNIESEVPENCPFVLTSPRSLEACRRAGVQVGCCHSITLGNKPYYYYYYYYTMHCEQFIVLYSDCPFNYSYSFQIIFYPAFYHDKWIV